MKSLCSERGLQRLDADIELGLEGSNPPSPVVLRFGAADAAGVLAATDLDGGMSWCGNVGHVHIDQVPAVWLGGVKVWNNNELVYGLDSVVCPKGLPVSAGEMIQAMARMEGESRLTLDLRHLGVRASQITVVLLLLPPAAALAHGVSVSLLAD
jgi:hypothetical protein